MTEDNKEFFEQLGQRIANQRKTQNMTQGHLAEHLGISQQYMASLKKVSGRYLPVLAQPAWMH